MGTVDLPEPPDVAASSHRDFAPWLSWSFFDDHCAYCVLRGVGVEVDHVVPKTYATERARDPTNLLPACRACNGPAGKSDYHPDHDGRRRLSADVTGFAVLDPRQDDYGRLFDVLETGRLEVQAGPEHDRALWNERVLLKLHLPKRSRARRELLDLLRAAEYLVGELYQSHRAPVDEVRSPSSELGRNASRLVEMVARALLFFELFDLTLSELLEEAVRQRRKELRLAECAWAPP